VTATHQGEFMGIPATGRRVGWTAIHIWRVENGRLKERWAEANLLRLLEELRGS
jgi:predicted ester cyclase